MIDQLGDGENRSRFSDAALPFRSHSEAGSNQSHSYKSLLINLAHPPLRNRRFWLLQAMVVVVFLIHLVLDIAQDRGMIPVPGFVWILLLFIPVVYAGTTFGLVGSLSVTIEGAVILAPSELLVRHSSIELWGAWSILAMVIVVAVLLGERYEKERYLRGRLLSEERERLVNYLEGHPLSWKHLVEMIPDGVVFVAEDGSIRYVNDRLAQLSGFYKEELLGKSIEMLVPPSSRQTHLLERMQFMSNLQSRTLGSDLGLKLWRKDSSELAVDIALAPLDLEGRSWVLAMVRDETARRQAELARAESEQRFRLAFEHNMDGMLLLDLEDNFLAVNDAFCKMVGYGREELIGKNSSVISHPDDQYLTAEAHKQLLSGNAEQVSYTKRYIHRDGRVIFAEVSKSCARIEQGRIAYLVASVRDVTEEHLLSQRLVHQATHDSLTGLANRLLFEEQLEKALGRPSDECNCLAVFFIDLDDFKGVNDTLGHQVGDQVLVELAGRLSSLSRPGDTLSRFGGDEFLYLAEGLTDPEEAIWLAERFLHVIEQPFFIAGLRLDQRGSIGLVCCTNDDRAEYRCGKDPSMIMRDVDTALYEAKRQGKGRYALFHPELRYEAAKRFELAQELRHAIDANELIMHYQPIVNLATSEIVGFEALMRWEHGQRGWVGPDIFIPVAEQSELIVELGALALQQATEELASWGSAIAGKRHPYISVNLSVRQFHDPALIDRIEEVLDASGIQPSQLVLEITESVALVDVDTAMTVIKSLNNLGISIALDDFGTGYSSLSYLDQLHPDIIKIDRSFIRSSVEGEHASHLVNVMISLGHSLDAMVVAEGIETRTQLRFLTGLDCDLGQGFIYSPAVPSKEALSMLVEQPFKNIKP